MGDLFEAIERIDGRKRAILGADADDPGITDGEEGLLLLSGSDLDPAEVGKWAAILRAIAAEAIANGESSPEVAVVLAVEGVAIGLSIAENRSRAGS